MARPRMQPPGVALCRGGRSRQEGAVLALPVAGGAPGLAVLSDGMGGHDDGDLAARLVAGAVFGDLFRAAARPEALLRDPETALVRAAEAANARLAAEVRAGGLGAGAGGTLVAVLQTPGQLAWLSVGDSLLALWRDGELTRLNADHSLAPQIDLMAERDELTREEAACHPQRSLLTSALTGAPIPKLEVRSGVALAPGDRLVLASDGLLTLGRSDLTRHLRRGRARSPQIMAEALVRAVRSAAVPDQDNVSVAVLDVPRGGASRPARRRPGRVGTTPGLIAPGLVRLARHLSGGALR